VTTGESGGAPERLRILWVVSKLTWSGGIGRVVAEGAHALAARGHELHVAGPAPDGAPPPLDRVTAHAWARPRWSFQNIAPLLRLQRSLRAHVIHFHSAVPHGELICAMLSLRRWLGAPRIFVSPHTSGRADYPRWRSRLGLRAADAVIAPSRWSADRAIAAGASASATHVVRAGIAPFEGLADTAREPVVLTIGQLRPNKGTHVLVDAFDLVTEEHPEWRLEIGGEGREEQALRARIASARHGDRIELLGYVSGERKTRALCRASIGAVPSLRESAGGVLLELEAAGLACVASDVGGMPEIANDGDAALLVPPDDAGALAEALRRLMRDAGLRERLSDAGRHRAGELDWSTAAEHYERIYRG
jgi:glycosyltransferase involved in cell wall biosynthesis